MRNMGSLRQNSWRRRAVCSRKKPASPPKAPAPKRSRRLRSSERSMPQTHKSLQGQLILDGGKLHGSFFHRSVVLVCQHDAEGAFGLILNRSTENKVGQALVANLPERIKEQLLFIGGPVQPQSLSFLHSEDYLPGANVMANLNLGHSIDALMDVSESFSS